jgi:ubiquitin carboxyl-terminal hydrolase L3
VDPDLLGMVPQPCVAVTLLFDHRGQGIREFNQTQSAKVAADGQTTSDKVFFMKQFVGNACGTIATVHSLCNNLEALGMGPETPAGQFFAAQLASTPKERGVALADAANIHEASEEEAAGGQTEAPDAAASVDYHFIAFSEVDGDLYEFDGGKGLAVNHGPTGGDLLSKATQVIKECFMDKEPSSMMWNMMALCKCGEE